MSELSTRHYKETLPDATVRRIQKILDQCGVEVEEYWDTISEFDTFSLRIVIKGTEIGSNGKGVNESYCRASAYAEFVERYQNLAIMFGQDAVLNDEFDFYLGYDEEYLTSEQVVDRENEVVDLYLSKCGFGGASRVEKVAFVQKNFKSSKYKYQLDKHICIPFYSSKEDQLVYLSPECTFSIYGSNGMAAGNTPEEAVVQGLSEIYERYVQRKVMIEGITLPDIPLEVIQSYPEIYDMYQKAKAIKGIEIQLKDASLGGKYPVVAMIVIEKNKGTFGIKFGAHADYGVAMERTFTEVTQGRRVSDYAVVGAIDFEGSYARCEENYSNAMKTGNAYYPYQLLLNKPTYDYVPVKDVRGLNGKEILTYMLKIAQDGGNDVLIRDMSMLGFPNYYIIIPTMSEMFEANLIHLRIQNTMLYLMDCINEIDSIDERVCKLIIGVLTYQENRILENQLHVFRGFNCKSYAPNLNIGEEGLYFLTMAYVYIGDYFHAFYTMNKILRCMEIHTFKEEEQGQVVYYKALELYLRAMVSIKNHDVVMGIVRKLYSEEACERIQTYFSNPKELFVKQYKKHSYRHIDGSKSTECCDYEIVKALTFKQKEKQLEAKIDQMECRKLFQ